jgi:hypothetical protein
LFAYYIYSQWRYNYQTGGGGGITKKQFIPRRIVPDVKKPAINQSIKQDGS